MTDYKAPVDDVLFVLNELLNVAQLNAFDDFAEATPDLLEAVIEEAGKFASSVYAPLNRVGDETGVKIEDGEVATPTGFRQAYQMFVENGWLSLAQSPDYGGQGLPFSLHMAAGEFWGSANMSLALCPMLTAGAIDALSAHASDALKEIYLPKLISGEWTGTMNLTESHAGSDLSTLKTKAIPNDDHYLIKGTKIFITWGEHDMAENIVHIVLAPMVDAPSGTKGLSLFVVPKFIIEEDGSLGKRNDVKAVSLEHKLGIHASPTCVMSFGDNEGAVGYLVGEPGEGLACMFTLMNHARLEVGMQGVCLSERAYQDAVVYAKERTQGRNPETGEPAMIIEHADVQRMLMQMKSMTGAMRALTYDTALSHDCRGHASDEQNRAYHQRRFAFLTPVTKAWCTELVNEVTSLGIQVHGGMGYIEETGVAQHFRDARITSIYEGTNGIQANDLVGRKLIADNGVAINELMQEMDVTVTSLQGVEALSDLIDVFVKVKQDLQEAANYILANHQTHPKMVGALAYNFMMQTGYVLGAWYQLRTAAIANEKDAPVLNQQKLLSARFYFSQVLPRSNAHHYATINGSTAICEISADHFS